ncbi:trypsin-like serine protease [Umezawaea endophytica]|uniref:Serine protease n=1 Tax=Umezawaea endophytica TaxID=1654476 RepID=A0A9X2VHP7_9PSEU|nr:serine protease [Umezawaea endophytica]MCS7476860.1 serine protease [Umezawaea endophytica]
MLRRLLLAPALTLAVIAMTAGHAGAIIGGHQVDQRTSWIASVQRPDGAHVCTGSLVAPQWVLMAFHCTLAGPDFQVRIGSLDRSRGGELVGSAEVRPHPTAYFDEETHTFGGTDLALVKLDRPVRSTPIPLLTSPPRNGSPLRLLGWGYTCHTGCEELPERLHEVTVPVDTEGCDTPERQRLCARDLARGVAAGDSGGPGVVRTPGGWRLAGVTSGGGQDVETGEYHTLQQDVSSHLEWLRATMGAGTP